MIVKASDNIEESTVFTVFLYLEHPSTAELSVANKTQINAELKSAWKPQQIPQLTHTHKK